MRPLLFLTSCLLLINVRVKAQTTTTAQTQVQSLDERLLFIPSKYPRGNWKPSGLNFRDVFFTAKDGTKLHGWYCPAENPRAVVLISHGNAGHVADRARWLRFFQKEARISVFLYDYRGYGKSEGIPTVAGILQDAQAARATLRELADVENDEMFLMGESLGGAVATQLAAEASPRGLILQSTFSSMRDVADIHYPRVSWMVPAQKLNSEAIIGRYRGPLLLSHGTADQIIPPRLGKKLFQAANDPKVFLEIPRAGHQNWFTRVYAGKLVTFIDAVNRQAEAAPDSP